MHVRDTWWLLISLQLQICSCESVGSVRGDGWGLGGVGRGGGCLAVGFCIHHNFLGGLIELCLHSLEFLVKCLVRFVGCCYSLLVLIQFNLDISGDGDKGVEEVFGDGPCYVSVDTFFEVFGD